MLGRDTQDQVVRVTVQAWADVGRLTCVVAAHLQSWGGNDSRSPIDRGGNGISVVPRARGLPEEEVVALGSQPERWVPAMGHPLRGGVGLSSDPSAWTFPFECRGPGSIR